jgi:hypothetical protein|nr:MAG TPA: hypothetical protein [Caudoviricetes sp.]DAQ97429.1 MAG TPA: hypothetical protein [Caudoviricetes sp.]
MEKTKNVKSEEKKVTIKVVEAFLDKYDNSIRYDVDTMLEFEAERAADVVSRGLAEYSEPVG